MSLPLRRRAMFLFILMWILFALMFSAVLLNRAGASGYAPVAPASDVSFQP